MVISKNVVLILGAGASAPYGFPVGQELARRMLSPSRDVRTAIQQLGFHQPHLEAFQREFVKFDQGSIDSFLEHRREDFGEIGKAIIASTLISCENPNALNSLIDSCEGKWYSTLFSEYILRHDGQRTVEQLQANRVRILTYNYDRSLQRWLINQMESLWRISFEEAKQIQCDSIPITHLHGCLGTLSDRPPSEPGDGKSRPYTTSLDGTDLNTAVGGIRIIHDVPDEDAYGQAIKIIRQAEIIVFLGFGYHPTNVGRLQLGLNAGGRAGLGLEPIPEARIFGTTLGFTPSQVRRNITPLFEPRPRIKVVPDQDVLQFLQNSHGLLL